MSFTRFFLLLATSGAGSLPAHAQTPEDVIVTARWREERLQDAPVSVTLFTERDLSARNLTRLDEIAPFTPNLVFDPGTGDTGGSTNAQIYLRGIGQSDFLFTTEPGVGIYVDGVYMGRAVGSMMDLVDVERIEVLKGPQGTVFGKNNVGGAINIVTRAPTGELGARVALTAGSLERADLSAIVDVPVAKGLSAKASFFSTHRDGYVERPHGAGDLGGAGATGGALRLRWAPAADFTLSLSLDRTRRRESTSADVLVAVDPAAPLLGLWNALAGAPSGAVYDARFVTTDRLSSQGTGPARSELDQWGAAATAEWKLGAGTLRSITAYRDQDARFVTDPDHSPLPYLSQGVDDRTHQFSQELQWIGTALGGRLDYVLGGLYLSESGTDIYSLLLAPGLFDALESLPPGIIPGLGGAGNPVHPTLDYDATLAGRMDNRSHALFAHADYRPAPHLALFAGLRWTRDEKAYRARFDRHASGVAVYDVSTSADWEAFTPTLGARYRWSPRLMTYVSAARGYKAGGFNGRSQTAFAATRTFAPEYAWTYEAGLKGDWLGGRARINAALFHTDYTDLQLMSLSSDGAAPVVVVENAGAASVDGFEVELSARPASGLRIDAGLGHLDAQYVRLGGAVAGVGLASRLPKSPAWTFNLGLEQAVETSLGRLTLRADYAWRSSVEHAADNLPPLRQKSFGLLGGRVAFQPPRARWSVALFGSNLTDARYITNGLSTLASIGTANATIGRPREWGVRLDHSF